MSGIISLQALSKEYGDVRAVDELSLEIEQGEVFGLLGPNGAGKTTTVQMLLGLTAPSSGRVRVHGVNPVQEPLVVRAQTGIVMQRPTLDPYLTGWENIQLYAELYPLDPGTRKERIERALDWAGLSSASGRLVRTYSGGMRRRLDLAIGTLHEPRLLLLDEPTLGLDVHTRFQLWELIRDLKAAGTTVLLTTHYLEEANRLCDRLAIMHHGKLVAIGEPGELRSRYLGESHRLTVRFRRPLELQELALPIEHKVDGDRFIFSGPSQQLWQVLLTIRGRYEDELLDFGYEEPSLDDVFVYLTSEPEEASA